MVSKYWPVKASINTEKFDHPTLSPQAIRHVDLAQTVSASEPSGDTNRSAFICVHRRPQQPAHRMVSKY
jgi:hypothetical protein